MHDADLIDEVSYRQARAELTLWRRARALGVSRRGLLQLLLAAAGTSAPVAGLPARPAAARPAARPGGPARGWFVKPTPPELFIDLDHAQETRWDAVPHGEYVTPIDRFYLNNRHPTPRIDPATYRLRVGGSGVRQPLALTYDELLALPATTLTRALECGQNGHLCFEQQFGRPFAGTRWRLGAIGVAEFTGVRLGEVLDRAGVKPSARDVMPLGLDARAGDPQRPSRVLPLVLALAEDTLLVYGMNGQPLPPDHGFPVRVFVPGWVATSSIKWVGEIVVAEEELTSDFALEHSLLVGPEYPPEGDHPGQLATFQSIKSAFELPWPATLQAGPLTLGGRSWSGRGRITRVEVSFDGGATVRAARLIEPNLPQAWVRWEADWDAPPGEHRLRARATDELGRTQPDAAPYNEHALLYDAVVDHPVTVLYAGGK